MIVSNWSRTGDEMDYEIVIPPDTSAVIELQVDDSAELTEGGKPILDLPTLKMLSSTGKIHQLQAGSGHYHFHVGPALASHPKK
jgi:alpha-L-rhamnosidase